MAARVLMIDDDRQLAAMLAEYLGRTGFDVTVRGSAAAGLEALRDGGFEALILDVMLPDGDGFDVCRRVRAVSDLPVLMLTARGEEADRVAGLEIGADDYLPKPFSPRELLARLRSILRRRGPAAPSDDVQRFGRLEIDRTSRVVRLEGAERPLTSYQFDILAALADGPGRVVSREALMHKVRGRNLEAFDRSIDVHISRIRAAIEDDPKHPRRILTVRGVGYVFARRQDHDPRSGD